MDVSTSAYGYRYIALGIVESDLETDRVCSNRRCKRTGDARTAYIAGVAGVETYDPTVKIGKTPNEVSPAPHVRAAAVDLDPYNAPPTHLTCPVNLPPLTRAITLVTFSLSEVLIRVSCR